MTYDRAARRKTPLALAIAAEIARSGPMPLIDYMRRCLWDPAHGYYATRNPLGRAGDFITAPEISQVFGELIGLWSAVVWRDLMAAPVPFTLAEFGPGRGTLMRDALRATVKVPGFHAGTRCLLIEASQPLIDQQRETLASSGVPVAWSDDANALAGPTIAVANEFLDAWPVQQWIMTNGSYEERCVVLDNEGNLAFSDEFAPTSLGLPRLGQKIPEGAIWQDRKTTEWIESLGALADRSPFAMLVIDYGHMKSAHGDTLQAVRNHAYEHPLTSPGEADLSTHVDFDALGGGAIGCGLATDGPITQAEFLGRLGIVERAHKLMAANPARAGEIEAGVARLIAPEGMGSRFKVLGLRSKTLPPLPGFEAATKREGSSR